MWKEAGIPSCDCGVIMTRKRIKWHRQENRTTYSELISRDVYVSCDELNNKKKAEGIINIGLYVRRK